MEEKDRPSKNYVECGRGEAEESQGSWEHSNGMVGSC